VLFPGAAAPLLLGALGTTAIGHVVGNRSVSKPASCIARMASGASQNSLLSFRCATGTATLPCYYLFMLYCSAIRRHELPLAAGIMDLAPLELRRHRSQDGGTEVLAGKRGGRDRSLEPLALSLQGLNRDSGQMRVASWPTGNLSTFLTITSHWRSICGCGKGNSTSTIYIAFKMARPSITGTASI
jgi:hypothetical protein